jgi:hypothetical protein
MKLENGMMVRISDKLAREIFLTLCEDQGINWLSGDSPRSFPIILTGSQIALKIRDDEHNLSIIFSEIRTYNNNVLTIEDFL